MTAKKLLLFCLLFMCQIGLAQHDSITNLNEVLISDTYLKNFSNTQSVQKLNDSIIEKNQPSLTSLLNYNTVIYFKENGLGMVSSPSFRGTTAQQTAVIWNGININSQLNGQTDFNTITTRDFSSISVRAGGGSAIYGSSAIGGSIHLNNDLDFRNQFVNELQLNFGSFNTLGVHYDLKASNENISSQVSISRNNSENDYKYLYTSKKNENGEYYSTSFNASVGYKINTKNTLKLYSQFFDSERHFSGTLAAPSKSKYQSVNARNMLEWVGAYKQFISKLKLAFLDEEYKYFEDKDAVFFTKGKAETSIVKYDLSFKAGSNICLNVLADFTQTKGYGSDIGENKRQIGSGALLMKHRILENLEYEISFRKEFTTNYKSPILYSLGAKYDISKNYALKYNVSRNFRIPTFNDLYWQGSGNPNLKPESSFQTEMGQEIKYKNITLSTTGYYIKIEDMLRWSPGPNGVWSPNNIAKVTTYGTEALFNWVKNTGKHHFELNGTYAYTVSNDEQKHKQLIYVPFHKITASASYSFKKVTASYQFLYNGQVFTSSDNYYALDSYKVSNLGIDYNFGKISTCKLGFQILNLLNENYQSVSMRPMPGRNINMNLTLKF
ncbi:TonB-dependent siderophore receptor [Flavobacterium sp. GT3R68]|uniref:TonB-dependent receptor plug domain-containing protein n=1 Tax=Flavobacterium sp. GT3R68 TaxID=2594437 RepID=UPI000F86656E|nr:TonB-dependent receptor [Flavobacterium sp. GT3R68]RTY87253.1 TonB-dependent receptor [Flavobacterium sp. GSN2]TRW89403.1 TonB-dependent receptor [Flavobacterium sp. GT3R68]